MATLIYITDKGNPEKVRLTKETTKIGRRNDNDIILPADNCVSRYHCDIVKEGDKYIFIDKNSKFGSLINNEQISKRELKYGDEIKLGNTILTFLDESEISKIRPADDIKTIVSESEIVLMRKEINLIKEENKSFPDIPVHSSSLSNHLGNLEDYLLEVQKSLTNLEKFQKVMQTIFEVGKIINSVFELKQLLNLVIDLALKVLHAERGCLMLINDETGKLLPEVERNMTEEIKEEGEMHISRNIAAQVAKNNKAIVTVDAKTDSRFKENVSILLYNIRSVICVPLQDKHGSVIGVIYIDNVASKHFFTDDDCELLTAFGNQAAIAIENAKLYENIKREEKFRQNFQRYLSPGVVDNIMLAKEDLKLGGEKKIVTTVFCDIKGFTSMSEKMSPAEVVARLNECFSYMVDIIFKYEGTLDKYMGDGFMAIFGAPISHSDDAVRAIKASLDIKESQNELNKQWRSQNKKEISIGFGINTGEVIAGNIGSKKRLEYTVISDAVNIAARLQSITEKNQILISSDTYRYVKDYIKCNKLKPVKVKGKSKPIEIYEVQGLLNIESE